MLFKNLVYYELKWVECREDLLCSDWKDGTVRAITVRVINVRVQIKDLGSQESKGRRARAAMSLRCCQVTSGEEQQLCDELQGV